MTIGLVLNQRDSDMVDVCEKVPGGWGVVWGMLPIDCISDALADESELIKRTQYYSHIANVGADVVEVVIVTLAEWERLMHEGDDLREQAERLRDQLDKLEVGE